MMSRNEQACPNCGPAATRKDGHDRRWRRRLRCSGCRFPPEVIGPAVRWYLRYRLHYADVAALLAGRGVSVAPPHEGAARPFRHGAGGTWSVDETEVKVAGAWADVDRAIGEHVRVVDVDVSTRRAAGGAATFFLRAIEATGGVPAEVTTDGAVAYPPALADVLPAARHQAGKPPQQRIERDQQHRKGRLALTRGCKTLAGARVLRAGFYALDRPGAAAQGVPTLRVLATREALTAGLLAR